MITALLVSAVIVVSLIFVLSLCRMAAPATEEEQRISDEEQIAAIEEYMRNRLASKR